ncbi:MAG: thiamine diphosphokinase [Acutalibacteraceae bacterium]|nr:thiamine diphosphokinase [Acutalibacteraceae bacterium]
MRLWLCLSSMNKICFVFGAGEIRNAKIKENSLIISADGGYEYLKKNNITPHIILGDFDSLGYVPKGENVIVYPAVKDSTDMALAVEKGIKLGCETFVLYGGMGGRIDHTLANIQLLSLLAEKGKKGYLVDTENVVTAICNSQITFSKEYIGFISVFSHSNKSEGVSIKGLKYELNDQTLLNNVALGVSNEFIGKESIISVKNGTLIITYKHQTEKFIDDIK